MGQPSVHRSCPLCEAQQEKVLWLKGSLRLVRCAQCGMIYANPVEQDYASGTFYDHRGEAYFLSEAKLSADYAPVRFERELKHFRKFCPRGSVMDVGCSSGGFLYQLITRYPKLYEVLGTDVSMAPLDYAESRGVPVLRKPFLEVEPRPQGFDALTFWAVLEHLIEPCHFLRQANVLLRPGGVCFVLVPNMSSLAVRLLGARYRYIMPDHLNYFTPATLKAFVQKVRGFEVLALTSTHFNPFVIWQDAWDKQTRVADADRAKLLKRTTALKQTPLLLPLKWAYAGCEVVLARLLLADNLLITLRRH